jgi:hypothetical protein
MRRQIIEYQKSGGKGLAATAAEAVSKLTVSASR